MTIDTPCREWRGTTRHGYGTRWEPEGKRLEYMHRWVMKKAGHDIKGKVVMHKCDNPPCYRYDHLMVGTQADNIADMRAKGRHNDSTSMRGEAHHQAKLTEDQVRAIRDDERRYADIAADYGLHRNSIGPIKNRRTWTHVS